MEVECKNRLHEEYENEDRKVILWGGKSFVETQERWVDPVAELASKFIVQADDRIESVNAVIY